MMKKTILAAFAALALLACSGSSNSNTDDEPVATKAKKSTFTDERDGKTYKYVKIGTQTWMAENLNYAVPLANEEGSTVIDAEVGSVCYDNKEDNCKKYGRLYYWVTAMGLPADCKSQRYNTNCYTPKGTQRQGICPAGWHLPTKEELDKLTEVAGGKNLAGKYLKATSSWENYDGNTANGEDKFGFSALPGGNADYEGEDEGKDFFGFWNLDSDGNWWSASENMGIYAYSWRMYNSAEVANDGTQAKYYLFYVRCLLD